MTTAPTIDSSATTAAPGVSAFRDLPFMGVIRVNEAAMKVGYTMGDPSWSNLGQGQPEVGMIDGAPPRYSGLQIAVEDHAYGPVEGLAELRQAVAHHYNRLFRQGHTSKYTAENVAVAAGGRLALSRIGATLEHLRLGYFTPDYTAYEDLMTTFHRLDPVWIELRPEDGFRIDVDALARRVEQDQIGALLISNPCNPTGVVMQGDELRAWVELARSQQCTLLMDEFYSHFMYGGATGPVSAAAFVEDVNEDPIVLVDGLTKCFRYPGWRVGWVVAPRQVIRTLTAAGSFLDGGPGRPIQRAAIDVLEPSRADQETNAVRKVFAGKQQMVIDRLSKLGVKFPAKSDGTFYVFGDISALPASINDGVSFMQKAFEYRVLVVPGEYFDVNPHRARSGVSGLKSFVRFSFGPPRENVSAGLDRLEQMVAAAK